MVLRSVFIRFYKSFNYDYLRKHNPQVTDKRPWEYLDSLWYPHVRVPVESSITTIVGENESGKSCLLSAIDKGLTGHDIKRKDFCRHAKLDHQYRYPEFGFEWSDLSGAESEVLKSVTKSDSPVDRFHLFRPNPKMLTVYAPGHDARSIPETDDDATAIADILPEVFWLKSKVALPESIHLDYLAGPREDVKNYTSASRHTMETFAAEIQQHEDWFTNADAIKNNIPAIAKAYSSSRNATRSSKEEEDALQLGHDLLRRVSNVSEAHFQDLKNTVSSPSDHAFAKGIVGDINDSLNCALNFPSIWTQDQDFRLTVSLQGRSLTLSICDRTGTHYAFDERSNGLRYFLSYYAQYLAFNRNSGKQQIVVMDEPDAYLSSRGQQDLLNVLQAFALPEEKSRRPVQVIYVTHSPFLIDKNRADQIRVLEKGVGEEGTRVVKDATRNRYEPLRSAFGAFLAETAFIGNCNLMVEGTSDQVLLAGASRHLRLRSDVPRLETLDINSITVVPTGGASQIPYLVFVALGRSEERPAVIVLLDSDKPGNDAKDILLKGIRIGKKHHHKLLREEQVLQVGDIHSGAVTIEDLVPLELAVDATHKYIEEYCAGDQELQDAVSVESVRAHNGGTEHIKRPLEAIQALIDTTAQPIKVQKVGFARAVVKLLDTEEGNTVVQDFEANMRKLLKQLNSMQRSAVQMRSEIQISRRFQREKEALLKQVWVDAGRTERPSLRSERVHLAHAQPRPSTRLGAALLRRVLFAHFTGVFDHGCALSGAFSGGRLQAGGPPDGPPAFFGCPTPPGHRPPGA